MLLGQKIGWGQVINGQVIDEETEQVLSYVNIGVVELGIGTVSDKEGKFSLQISEGTADSVLFSAVGYSSRKVAITDLIDNDKVWLTSRSYEMQSFEVVDKGGGRDKIFGIKKGIPAGYTGLASNKPGDEIGTPIKIRKPTYLKSAHFTIDRVSGDSMIYRVNIYEFNDGEIGRNLVSENVLLEGVQKHGVVSVDLTPFELVISEDVLLTLENIQVDSEEHNHGIGFRYKSVFFRNRNIYGRIGDKSKNLAGEFSEIIQGSALNFYFVGNEL
ncbi:carboxypeptidase-like regulatory domain-containing protein [Gracilimonas amylolytica]|uniref:carboxypeptidase-like regulatory domain-containing protein n=1 Tax=Gracilimonas amylolytica TaxID=1749045 RepID=UPI0012FFD8FE|nr:carboxypeptidase-like regulatory domain-containing protein [Gracilimonas amylolytica]